ncbi:prominin-1-A-like [Dysidea avara]|uniref:prominin-1-A-like n=1 Tax=Dysidea avara TaxID=196820 RepID=UPI0033212B40
MMVLWACLVALCSLGVVSSCNISLGGHNSVPDLCLSIQEEAARLVSTILNFTLAENGSIIFASLPPTREVSVSVNDDSDGLRGWTNIANSFVDSVRSGSLPYDVILPILNSSVDSPIATADCFSNQQRTGSGDFELRDILEDFGEWWAPILVVTVLGPLFALLFIIVGCCFCCCRLCGKCGGDLKQKHRSKNDLRCLILYIVLVLCVCLLCIGVVFAFVSNEKLNDSVRGFNTTVNTAIDNSLNFIDDTQMQANATVDRYDEVNTFVQCQVDNSHLTIGIIVVDVFEGAVAPLINSSLELATDLNNSINALRLVNSTVVKLLSLTQRLQTELNGVTAMLQALQTSCVAAGGGSTCNSIPTESYTVTVNYTVVEDVSSVLDQLVMIDDLKEQVLEANATFYSIPCDIRNQIQGPAEEILDQANSFRDTIRNIANDIEREVRNIVNEEGFVGDTRTQSSDIQEQLDKYDTPRYAISIAMCSLTAIVIIILIVGLLLGATGFQRNTEPPNRTQLSHYGGITLIYCGVPLMFIFAVILLLLTSITFFFGANMLKVCYSISEDPPNDDIPSYELFSRIVDNSDLWGGYLLGCYILDDSRIPLTVTDMLNGCRANQAVYEVAQLRLRPGLNLDDVVNITNQIPNLDGLFDKLREQISFNLDQILTPEARDSINAFTNAGLQAIDYVTYISQITSQISTLAVDSTISTLETVRDTLSGIEPSLANSTQDIIDEIIRINQTTIAEIINCTQLLEQQIIMLNETAVELSERVQEILDNANATVAELNGPNGTQLVLNRTEIVLNRVITFATDFANWAIDNLENEIGRCQPLYATYSNLYYEACKDAVDGINAFWLAIGWCVLFFIPTLVFAVWLSHYLRRMKVSPYSYIGPSDQIENTSYGTSYHRLDHMKS